MAIVILSHYQPPVNYRIRNVQGNPQNELPLLLSFSRLGIYISILMRGGFVFSRTMKWLYSQNSPLLGKLYWNM
jgi:hypothetical protein